MAQMNGKTPEKISKEIIDEAVENIVVELNGVRGQELEELIRYKFSKKVYSKGERWFQANLDSLRTEFLENIIESQYKQRTKLDIMQEKKDQREYYDLLVSRGMSKLEAAIEAGLIDKPEETAPEPALVNNEAAPVAVSAAEVKARKEQK